MTASAWSDVMGKSLAAILLKNLRCDAFFAAYIGICN